MRGIHLDRRRKTTLRCLSEPRWQVRIKIYILHAFSIFYIACTYTTDMIPLAIPFKKCFTFRFWTVSLRCTKTKIGGKLWHSQILDAGVVWERARIILTAESTSGCAHRQANVTILLRWRIVRMQSPPIKECQGRSFLLI